MNPLICSRTKLFIPIIEGADEEIRETCYETAKRLYGEPIPDVVVQRLEKELVPIIKYGFSANYLISERLVKKSNEDGYLSRLPGICRLFGRGHVPWDIRS